MVSEGSSSLFAHSVQENVSPTYALPKASGRLSTGLIMNWASASSEGYAREAFGEMPRVWEAEIERGYWCARDGRESLGGFVVSWDGSR